MTAPLAGPFPAVPRTRARARFRWLSAHRRSPRSLPQQFKAVFLKATAPTTTEGIEKYFGSGMIRGIGPLYARKLARAFGEAVFEIIEQEFFRLQDTLISEGTTRVVIPSLHRTKAVQLLRFAVGCLEVINR